MKTTFAITICLFSILLSGCSVIFHGFDTDVSYTELSKPDCLVENIRETTLFFNGEPIHFSYKKKGLIEVTGSNSDTDNEILQKLKEEAKLKCADAVIAIQSGYIDRKSGIIFDFDEENKTIYTARFYKGIAVKILP